MSYPRYSPLTREEVKKLAERWQKHGDLKARERLADSLNDLPQFVMKKFFRIHFNSNNKRHDDLIQAGQLGNLKAIDKFDSKLGVKLFSYAFGWVRAYMERELYIMTDKQRFGSPNGQHRPVDLSLDQAITSDNATLHGSLGDKNVCQEQIFDDIEEKSQTELLLRLMEKVLTKRETLILRRRYYNTYKVATLTQVASENGVSRERIRQIEKKALIKLREALKKYETRCYAKAS